MVDILSNMNRVVFMIKLEETFISGDGGFSTDPQTYTQIKRTDKSAIYQVSRDGKINGFEVFLIKILPKGTQIFAKTQEEDEEKYPSTGTFGKTAWFCATLERANERYEELNNASVNADAEEEKKENLIIPVGEFSTKDFAESNKIEYPIAFLFIKSAIEENKIKFVREERRNVKGKPSKIYTMA